MIELCIGVCVSLEHMYMAGTYMSHGGLTMWYPCKWLPLYCGMRTCTWIAVVVKYIVVHRIAPAPNAPPAGRGLALSVFSFFAVGRALRRAGVLNHMPLDEFPSQMPTCGPVA